MRNEIFQIHLCKFNRLIFIAEVSKKLQKCTFLTTITLNGNMKLRQMTQFHLSNSFGIWKYSKFFFMLSPLWSILICTIPQVLTKSIFWQKFFNRFGQLIILSQKVDILKLLKIYIMFCPPTGAKYHFLDSSSWIIINIWVT